MNKSTMIGLALADHCNRQTRRQEAEAAAEALAEKVKAIDDDELTNLLVVFAKKLDEYRNFEGVLRGLL
jgi:hypothetical protein